MKYQLHHGDCLPIMAAMPDNYFDSSITDPPYGLKFMGKDWDHGIPGIVYWKEVLRVLKPGAMLLAFGGTRTHHRLMVAIEDAGFEIRDCIMYVYGSGFPKSTNISKQIDSRSGQDIGWFGSWLKGWRVENKITQKEIAALFPSKTGGLTGCVANWELGYNLPTPEQFNRIVDAFGLPFVDIEAAEREIIGEGYDSGKRQIAILGTEEKEFDITAPATNAAKTWDGFGSSLKPAYEPILVCMKPRDGTFANNALTHGVAGFNIDGARIPTDGEEITINTWDNGAQPFGDGAGKPFTGRTESRGRWPANFCHDGSDEVMRLFPNTKSGMGAVKRASAKGNNSSTVYGSESRAEGTQMITHGDQGSAARFFYCSKSGTNERHAGLDDFYWKRDKSTSSGFVRIDRDEWQSLDEGDRAQGNIHSTVKPIGLMRWLAGLTSTPTGGSVIDPFHGSGSTGIGCQLAGRSEFVGIDITPEYVEIARARMRHWSGEKALDEWREGKPTPAAANLDGLPLFDKE